MKSDEKSDKKSDMKSDMKIGQEIQKKIERKIGQEIEHEIGQDSEKKLDTKTNKKLDMKSDKTSNLKPGPDDVTARFLKELADDIAAQITWLFNHSLSNGIKFSRLAGRPSLFLFISQVPRTLRLTTEALHYFQFCLRCWRNVS